MATFQGLNGSALHLLYRAAQRADQLFARKAGRNSLTPRQFAVLTAVAGANGLSQTAIMAATGIDRSSTGELVSRLVAKDLLQRRRVRRDSRTYAVRITVKGQEMLRAAEPAVRSSENDLLAGLTAAQRSDFMQALSRIAVNE
jgi:DNA-binding MarR family transcriptional regulator